MKYTVKTRELELQVTITKNKGKETYEEKR